MTKGLRYFKKDGTEVFKSIEKIIDPSDTWLSSKVKVISYDGCKKIAKDLEIQVCKLPAPKLECKPIEGNRQQHIWSLFVEYKNKPSVWEFSEGEASQLNTGKIVNVPGEKSKHTEVGQIDAMYKSNMAYKRAYCRAVLKIVGLSGIYSAVEAQAFQKTGNYKEM